MGSNTASKERKLLSGVGKKWQRRNFQTCINEIFGHKSEGQITHADNGNGKMFGLVSKNQRLASKYLLRLHDEQSRHAPLDSESI